MIECINFKSYQKGSLQGFADFYLPRWGVEIKGCSLYMKDGQRWLNLPSQPYKNEDGDTKYAPSIRFREKTHYDRFCEQAKAAIDDYCAKQCNAEAVPVAEEVPF